VRAKAARGPLANREAATRLSPPFSASPNQTVGNIHCGRGQGEARERESEREGSLGRAGHEAGPVTPLGPIQAYFLGRYKAICTILPSAVAAVPKGDPDPSGQRAS